MSHGFAVVYNDRHVDLQLENFDTIKEAIDNAEEWITDLGYTIPEWSKHTKAKNIDDLKAMMTYYHPCESDYVSIFKLS